MNINSNTVVAAAGRTPTGDTTTMTVKTRPRRRSTTRADIERGMWQPGRVITTHDGHRGVVLDATTRYVSADEIDNGGSAEPWETPHWRETYTIAIVEPTPDELAVDTAEARHRDDEAADAAHLDHVAEFITRHRTHHTLTDRDTTPTPTDVQLRIATLTGYSISDTDELAVDRTTGHVVSWDTAAGDWDTGRWAWTLTPTELDELAAIINRGPITTDNHRLTIT